MKKLITFAFICILFISNSQSQVIENNLTHEEFKNIQIHNVSLYQIAKSNGSKNNLENLFNSTFILKDLLGSVGILIYENSVVSMDFEQMDDISFEINGLVVKPGIDVSIKGVKFKIGDNISILNQFSPNITGNRNSIDFIFTDYNDSNHELSYYLNQFLVEYDPNSNLIIGIKWQFY